MAEKKRGLGSLGYDLLFENPEEEASAPTNTLRISEIQPRKNQPRKEFDSEALSELADSIAKNGLIQPIVVRKAAMGLYEIIAGERRWRASKLAGLTEVPVVIVEADDKKTAELALIENIQREDLNACEEAMAYKSLIDEFGMTQEAVAQSVGKSRVTVTNALRLLELPKEVLTMLAEGSISAGHARALLGLNNKEIIGDIALIVAENELSVRATEEFVRKRNAYVPKTPETVVQKSVKDVDYTRVLEKRIENTLGRRVKITEGKRAKKIELEYTDNDDLEKLLKSLCGESFFDESL